MSYQPPPDDDFDPEAMPPDDQSPLDDSAYEYDKLAAFTDDIVDEYPVSGTGGLDFTHDTPATGVTPIGGMPALSDDTAYRRPVALPPNGDSSDLDAFYPLPPGYIPPSQTPPTPDASDLERPRQGRARDRIEQRKAKRTGEVPAARVSPVRNAAPGDTPRPPRDPANVVTRGITSARSAAAGRSAPGGLRQIPARGTSRIGRGEPGASVRLPINRAGLYIIGSLIFIVAVVIILGQIRNRPADALPNAIWIGTEWTYGTEVSGSTTVTYAPRTEAEIAALVERLRAHQIGKVYAWVSWLQPDSTWRGQANFENVQTFVKRFNALYPEAELYGWVSFPVDVEIDGVPTYRMDDEAVQQTVADFSRRVVDEFGFEGVFLNIEQVWNNDANFLAMLRRVRATLGENISISAAIPPDWSPIGAGIPVPPLIQPGTVWDTDYKQSVALLIDEMAVMAYNSGLGAPSDYSVWVAYQTQVFAEAIAALGSGTEVVIGIPTYDAEPPGHDPRVENIITAVDGVREGINQAGDAAGFVTGIALYAGWTTDDQEWDDFRQSWVR